MDLFQILHTNLKQTFYKPKKKKEKVVFF